MDLSKAFDTIPHALLQAKLEAYGLSSSACALLKDCLSGSLQKVKIGELTSEWAAVSREVLQGTVLGPLFLNIFLNDLFYHFTEVKLHAFADDEQLLLYDSDIDLKLVDRRLMRQLNIAKEWYTEKQRYVVQSYQTPGNDHRTHGSCVFLSGTKINAIAELFGITVDDRLCFHCVLMNTSLQAGKRLRNYEIKY